MKKKILIISYFFPPYSGISARRWAKFAKYLSREYEVEVIAALSDKDTSSPWDADIKNIKVHYIDSSYPDIVNRIPENFIEKLLYKLAIRRLKKKVLGTIYDRAVFWEKILIDKAEEIFRSFHPDILICNGPPHRVLYYGAQLKKMHPECIYIADFRDPWTWWNNFDYQQLKGESLKFEMNAEETVMRTADWISVSTGEFKEHLNEKYPETADKVRLIPHGFDPDEIRHRKKKFKFGNKIRFIYFGTLYTDLENTFETVNQFFLQNAGFNLEIYSDFPKYNAILNSSNIEFCATVPATILFDRLENFDLFLYCITEPIKNNFSTKIYELVFARIPIVIIGPKGELSEFITSNNLGMHFEANSFTKENFTKRLSEFRYNDQMNISSNSFPVITEKIKSLF